MSPKHTIYCLGEVLLALDADAPLAHAESFRPRLGGDAAVLAQACAAQGGCASLLAQLGEDPFGQRAASTLAAAGVDTTHASFSRTLPTALLFEAGGEALSYRVRTAGLQFAPEQLEPGLLEEPPHAVSARAAAETPAAARKLRREIFFMISYPPKYFLLFRRCTLHGWRATVHSLFTL